MENKNLKGAERANFYGSVQWQKLRSKVKGHWRRAGLPCGLCRQKLDWAAKGSVVVDHIKPRRTHPHLALSPLNLWCLCSRCHSGAKAVMERGKRPEVGLDGWPLEGG
jgi:5-methylcytosine-specific restriction endonuclease McrA